MLGNIHSFDTFGSVDGPGVRFVVFTQGCPLRCSYCHNPDTWCTHKNQLVSTDEIIKKYEQVKEFTKGGITVTGGEPLLQIEFVTELFELCKQRGVHTCIDTSGATFSESEEVRAKFDRLMAVTDLVLLDLKHIDDAEHRKLTGVGNKRILQFAQYLSNINKDVWIRQVVIEGITLNETYLKQLGYFLATLRNIKALDIIPYHTMAIEKYEKLGMPFKLQGVEATSTERTAYALKIVVDAIKEKRGIK